MNRIKQSASAYRNAGISILPVNVETKAPTSKTWKDRQQELPSPEIVEKDFSCNGRGIGMICGQVSGNLECIDFDQQAAMFHVWNKLVDAEAPDLVRRLVIQKTQNGGRHVVYRCDSEVSGAKKMAADKEGHVLIETRGTGNYFIAAPSQGYKIIHGDFAQIPTITAAERDVMIEAARGLNQQIPKPKQEPPLQRGHDFGTLPGDDYNHRGEVEALLIKNGWVSTGRPSTGIDGVHWRRPGKHKGQSATLFSNRLFYVFSTSAAPLEADQAYTPFTLYAHLEHEGDFSAAARDLATQGFGDRNGDDMTDLDAGSAKDKGQKKTETGGVGFRFVHISEVENRVPEWAVKGLMEIDTLIEFFGDPASGKTLLAIDIAACVASGTDFNGRKVKKGSVAYIAGEGQNGIKRRFMAWSIRHDVKLENTALYVSLVPAALCDQEQHQVVVSQINAIAADHGSPALIVIDTVARNFGPGDENSTQDMTAFIQAVDTIRATHRSTVLLVHHTGHADKTRARGAMALKGALDAEYRLDRDNDGVIRVECTKMKDFQMPESMAFRIRAVELGIKDENGQPVTSAVLDPTAYEPKAAVGKIGRGKNQTLGLEVLQAMFNERRQNLIKREFDPKTARVSVNDWRDACVGKDMDRRAFFKIKDSLQKAGTVKIEHGYVDII